jgi:hypothetical protein
MLVMIANNTGREARRLLETFPDRIGHIYSPGGFRGPWQNYGVDNGAFTEWSKGRPFQSAPFIALLNRLKTAAHAPRWVAVPDVVTDKEGTLERWREWEPRLREYGWPLAFVVQNGMKAIDVPASADAIFVGGDTEWKQATAHYWCERFARVHVGRVNGEKDLWRYHRAGAESCDGTGWFRGARKQLDGLWYYLADTEGEQDAAHGPMQPRFDLSRARA